MTDPDTPRHIEVREGDQTVAAAEVMACQEPAGTARVWLHAPPGHVAPGRRANLVDAVMGLPEAHASARLEATVPLGDTEFSSGCSSAHMLRSRARPAAPRWWMPTYRRPADARTPFPER